MRRRDAVPCRWPRAGVAGLFEKGGLYLSEDNAHLLRGSDPRKGLRPPVFGKTERTEKVYDFFLEIKKEEKMNLFYDLSMSALPGLMRIHSLFNAKSRDAVRGRSAWRSKLRRELSRLPRNSRIVWFHAASLGEFEQGRPVLETLRQRMPEIKILLTFFSPSGYNVRKDYPGADIVTYLPLDTPAAARDFVRMVRPAAAVFIKYEFWGNFLQRIRKENIPLFLISAHFDARQVFFKPYGRFMRRLLPLFTRIFTQDGESVSLLRSIGVKHCQAAGDTRFDRVMDILQADNTLDFMQTFKGDKKLVVAGSAWPDDERLMRALIASHAGNTGVKFLIAPHDIHPEQVRRLQQSIPGAVLYSRRQTEDLASARVLILDTVGILTKVYSYADMTLVGGGFTRSGIHNVLEPAVFARPVICGPNYAEYIEAVGLKGCGGLSVVGDEEEFIAVVDGFLRDGKAFSHSAVASRDFVRNNAGATGKIVDTLVETLARK